MKNEYNINMKYNILSDSKWADEMDKAINNLKMPKWVNYDGGDFVKIESSKSSGLSNKKKAEKIIYVIKTEVLEKNIRVEVNILTSENFTIDPNIIDQAYKTWEKSAGYFPNSDQTRALALTKYYLHPDKSYSVKSIEELKKLMENISIESDARKYVCPKCGKECSSREDLQTHILYSHNKDGAISEDLINEWIADEQWASKNYLQYIPIDIHFRHIANDERGHHDFLVELKQRLFPNSKKNPIPKKESILKLNEKTLNSLISDEKMASDIYFGYIKVDPYFVELSNDEKLHHDFLMDLKEALFLRKDGLKHEKDGQNSPLNIITHKDWWTCPICGAEFDRPSDYERHILICEGDNSDGNCKSCEKEGRVCPKCGRVFSDHQEMLEHLNTRHADIGEFLDSDQKNIKKKTIKHSDKDIICPICSKYFYSESEYNRHVKEEHPSELEPEYDQKTEEKKNIPKIKKMTDSIEELMQKVKESNMTLKEFNRRFAKNGETWSVSDKKQIKQVRIIQVSKANNLGNIYYLNIEGENKIYTPKEEMLVKELENIYGIEKQ